LSRKLSCSGTFAFLLSLRGLAREPTQQRVDDGACVPQLGEGGQRCLLIVWEDVWRLVWGAQVSPGCGDQRACPVGQHQDKMKASTAMYPAQHLQRPPLEGMTSAKDGHPLGISIEVVVMGSVSCLRSMPSTTSV
jgi:hypothetical protein